MQYIEIDGAQGEGGGQILRSALALSVITQKPFRLYNIRAKRAKPGLLRQHLTAVQGVQAISRAQVEGATLRSTALTFVPQRVKAGTYHFSIGTAGSTSLVLQALVYPLLMADGPSKVTIEGGTHNAFAPPFEYLTEVLLPVLKRMGMPIHATLERYGFYPQGGGRVVFEIEPMTQPAALTLMTCPAFKTSAEVIHSGMPEAYVAQAFKPVRHRLGWEASQCVDTPLAARSGKGAVLYVRFAAEQHSALFTGFGGLRVAPQSMAKTVLNDVCRFMQAQVPVDQHLADQLLLPMALVGQGCFLTQNPSLHTETNRLMIQTFLPTQIHLERVGPDQCEVRFQSV